MVLKYQIKNLILISTIFSSFGASALVDYSEPESAPAPRVKRKQAPKVTRRVQPNRTSRNSGPSGMFDVKTRYETTSVSHANKMGKVSMLALDAHFQTNYNIFVDADYFGASADSTSINESTEMEQGNPKILIGFNWLKFGQAEEAGTIDIYGGAQFGGSSSIATSRTDTIVGVETTKRFYDFAVGIGYELNLVKTPDNDEETAIGNFQILKGTLAWMARPGIHFVVEGGTVKINESSDQFRDNRLEEGVSYSYARPTLILGIAPSVNLELGATFRTKRLKAQTDLLGARMWNVPGTYGNSMFAGLSLSL